MFGYSSKAGRFSIEVVVAETAPAPPVSIVSLAYSSRLFLQFRESKMFLAAPLLAAQTRVCNLIGTIFQKRLEPAVENVFQRQI